MVFGMIWAFGGGLTMKDGIDYRKNFDRWFKGKYTTVRFPGKGLVFDFYVDVKKGKLAQWTDLVETVTFDSRKSSMGSVFVPTAETASQVTPCTSSAVASPPPLPASHDTVSAVKVAFCCEWSALDAVPCLPTPLAVSSQPADFAAA